MYVPDAPELPATVYREAYSYSHDDAALRSIRTRATAVPVP
ncbi:MAG TPA: hypothetical protein VFH68_01120 [Polyangia bacterium]|nr:hypothetical protein [Polyangia bacterium]